MKRFIIIFCIQLFLFPIMGQNLIGKKKQDVENLVRTVYPGMMIDRSTVNHTYKYLKYVNNTEEQTLLVFLTDNDVCSATKLISSYSSLPDVKKDLNRKYKQAGKDTWKFNENGNRYVIKLKREDWFFTVFTGKEK